MKQSFFGNLEKNPEIYHIRNNNVLDKFKKRTPGCLGKTELSHLEQKHMLLDKIMEKVVKNVQEKQCFHWKTENLKKQMFCGNTTWRRKKLFTAGAVPLEYIPSSRHGNDGLNNNI